MVTKKTNIPKYVQNANFIREEEEVDEDWWPRDPYIYTGTKKWSERVKRLEGIINTTDIQEAFQLGDIYKSANNTVCFINDLDGLVIYVVADAQLLKVGDSYPTDPDHTDYNFKAVTVWPYVYDRDSAWATGRWTGQQLDEVEEITSESVEQYL